MQGSAIPMQAIRNDYTSTAVTTGAFVQLSASLTEQTSTLEVFDSSGQVLQLAIGPAGSEQVIPWYICPGGNGLIGFMLNKGMRLSVKAISASATTGQLVINLYR